MKIKKRNYSLNRLWLIGFFTWITYQIGSIIFFAFPSNELDVFPQFFNSSKYIVFSSYAVWISYLTYKKSISQKYRYGRIVFGGIIAISSIYFFVQNIIPRTIEYDPAYPDSPFDELWYSMPQNSFGYPFPYLRYLYYELEGMANPIIDFASFFSNIFTYCFFIYLLVGLYLLIQHYFIKQ